MPANSNIYAAVLRACQPLRLGGPLVQRVRQPSAAAVVADPAALRAALAEFPLDQLRASGVALPGSPSAAEPQFHPGLLGSPIFSVRKQVAGPPEHLLVETGCLHGNDCLPIVAAGDDWRRLDRSQQPRTLYLTGSLADAATLGALGFFATTTAGLDRVGHQALDQLCAHYGWPRRGGATKGRVLPHDVSSTANAQFVLVGWQPSENSPRPPQSYAAVVGHLQRLRSHLGIAIPPMAAWTIKPETAAKFAFIADHGSARELADALWESAKNAAPLFPAPVPAAPQKPALRDLLHCRADRSLWGDAADDDDRAAAVNYEAIIDSQIIDRLLVAADECGDPIDANLYFILATLSRKFHEAAGRMTLQDRSIIDIADGDSRQFAAQHRTLLQLTSQIMALVNVLRRQPLRRT